MESRCRQKNPFRPTDVRALACGHKQSPKKNEICSRIFGVQHYPTHSAHLKKTRTNEPNSQIYNANFDQGRILRSQNNQRRFLRLQKHQKTHKNWPTDVRALVCGPKKKKRKKKENPFQKKATQNRYPFIVQNIFDRSTILLATSSQPDGSADQENEWPLFQPTTFLPIDIGHSPNVRILVTRPRKKKPNTSSKLNRVTCFEFEDYEFTESVQPTSAAALIWICPGKKQSTLSESRVWPITATKDHHTKRLQVQALPCPRTLSNPPMHKSQHEDESR